MFKAKSLLALVAAFLISHQAIASQANSGTPSISGDVSIPSGSTTATLATVNSNVGSFGGSNAVPVLTLDGKGRVTAASTAATVGSFNGRTGTVTPTSGDYSVGQVTGAASLASPTFTGTVNGSAVVWAGQNQSSYFSATGTGADTVPVGTTGQAPTASNGMLRYDSTLGKLRTAIASAWQSVFTTADTIPVANGGTGGNGTSSPTIAAVSPYNFYDRFTGTVANVSGRTPDTVSNGNTWTATGANYTYYSAGGGALQQISAPSSNVAYAQMQTTCPSNINNGIPQEVGGTFTSTSGASTISPTIAVWGNSSGGFGQNMVHPNILITPGGATTASFGYWLNGTGGIGFQWADMSGYTNSIINAATAYNYREFYNGNNVTIRIENASTGAVVAEWDGFDPHVITVGGGSVFFETGDGYTQWTAAWARCGTAISTQTSASFPGGLTNTSIGASGDVADASFLSAQVGVAATSGASYGNRLGVFQVMENANVGNTNPWAYFIGDGTNGNILVASNNSGSAAGVSFVNGTAFSANASTGCLSGSCVTTSMKQGTTTLAANSSYQFTGTTYNTQWLTVTWPNVIPDFNNGVESDKGFIATGTTFTISSGCSSATSLTGGATAGKLTAGSTSCSPVLSLPAYPPNGWACSMNDMTSAITFRQTASTTSSATMTASGSTGASDVIDFYCVGY